MPYSSNQDLPSDLQDILPKHARDIYREAFNSAHEQYVEEQGRDESAAHAVAWSAVKNKYQKNEETGKWELNQGETAHD